MTPPTWQQLHAAGVPRPEGLVWADCVCEWHLDPIQGGGCGGNLRHSIQERHADSLCQIEAVKMLGSLAQWRDVRISRDGEMWCVELWTMMAGGEPDMCDVSECAPDLDTALRAACAAALPQPSKP